jgi:hypothetical protein
MLTAHFLLFQKQNKYFPVALPNFSIQCSGIKTRIGLVVVEKFVPDAAVISLARRKISVRIFMNDLGQRLADRSDDTRHRRDARKHLQQVSPIAPLL